MSNTLGMKNLISSSNLRELLWASNKLQNVILLQIKTKPNKTCTYSFLKQQRTFMQVAQGRTHEVAPQWFLLEREREPIGFDDVVKR